MTTTATTLDDVLDVMERCTSDEDWDEATDMIRSANGGELPPFWPALIGEGGLRARLRQQWQPAQQGGSGCTA